MRQIGRLELEEKSELKFVCFFCPCVTIIIISEVRLNPLGTAATSGLLYKPQMIDEDDCGEINFT
jgi:hypothetical protein